MAEELLPAASATAETGSIDYAITNRKAWCTQLFSKPEESEVNDYEAVRRTISLYSQLMDQGRFEEFGELFTEDAVSASIAGSVNPVSWTAHGRADIVTNTRNIVGKLLEQGDVIHLAANPVIDVDGDSAKAWWDVVVLQITPTGFTPLRSGRYQARLVKRESRWLLSHRTLLQCGGTAPTDFERVPPV